MNSSSPIWFPDVNAEREHEHRIQVALLCGVAQNLRGNCLVVPVFGLAICAMFSQWVPLSSMALWYTQMLVGLVAQAAVLMRLPQESLDEEQLRKWSRRLTIVNLFFVGNWTLLGWHLWVDGANANHVMIQLILAATLAAHASVTAPCRAIARPALVLYLAVLTLVPLQAFLAPQFPESFARAALMAMIAPFYVGFIAFIARRNHARARNTITMSEERNALLAELVLAKLESDRGREQAEAASLAKSQFLANMSHELRTPLNAILGFSELIATRIFASEPERNVEYAKMINTSGHHLLALINDILDLAKIEAGRWQLDEAELDLHRIAEDALQLVMWRAKDNNATLENAVPADIATVYADERAIKQVLLNLLSNAVKFTPEHGRVTAFAHTDDKGGLVLGVRDTGVGIAPEDQRRVFDSFGQGKHDVAILDKGTGLGLAIVKGLAEAHGGHVRLESEVGKGTCVSVHLPATRVRPRRRPNERQSVA